MACAFDDEETYQTLTVQIKDYLLSLAEGECTTQRKKVLFMGEESQITILQSTMCSDIEHEKDEGTNRKFYMYNDEIQIVLWIVNKS